MSVKKFLDENLRFKAKHFRYRYTTFHMETGVLLELQDYKISSLENSFTGHHITTELPPLSTLHPFSGTILKNLQEFSIFEFAT